MGRGLHFCFRPPGFASKVRDINVYRQHAQRFKMRACVAVYGRLGQWGTRSVHDAVCREFVPLLRKKAAGREFGDETTQARALLHRSAPVGHVVEYCASVTFVHLNLPNEHPKLLPAIKRRHGDSVQNASLDDARGHMECCTRPCSREAHCSPCCSCCHDHGLCAPPGSTGSQVDESLLSGRCWFLLDVERVHVNLNRVLVARVKMTETDSETFSCVLGRAAPTPGSCAPRSTKQACSWLLARHSKRIFFQSLGIDCTLLRAATAGMVSVRPSTAPPPAPTSPEVRGPSCVMLPLLPLRLDLVLCCGC